jgi:hypothetical protein
MNLKLSLEEIVGIIKGEMPFIEASENIWKFYAKTMCKWMKAVHLIEFRNNYLVKVNAGLSSFDDIPIEQFFPTVQISQIEKMLTILRQYKEAMNIQQLKKTMKRSSLNGHLADAYDGYSKQNFPNA